MECSRRTSGGQKQGPDSSRALSPVKYLSNATSNFIVRVPRAHYRVAWAALSCMNHVPTSDGRPCLFRVLRVSGTIRRVEEEAVRRARLVIVAARAEMTADAPGSMSGSSGGRTALDALLKTGAADAAK